MEEMYNELDRMYDDVRAVGALLKSIDRLVPDIEVFPDSLDDIDTAERLLLMALDKVSAIGKQITELNHE